MTSSLSKLPAAIAGTLVLALGVTACGEDSGSGGGLSGTIRADGSSTVAPLTEAAAEFFQEENSDVRVTVGTSGTGGGFEKFCAGETDISDASRPIEPDEVEACKQNGVEFEEIQVANDALSVVVNPENPVTCLTVDQLNQIWDKDSTVDSWGDVDGIQEDVGDEQMALFGPGTDSGTFDYFTEAINGEEGVSRSDYNNIGEDDNAVITGVGGDQWALGYVPFSFVEEAGDQVKAVQIENPETGECVEPTSENVQNGTYAPLGRALYIYPSAQALQKEEVVSFVEFFIENQAQITEAATYIPMTEEQVAQSQQKVERLAAAGGS